MLIFTFSRMFGKTILSVKKVLMCKHSECQAIFDSCILLRRKTNENSDHFYIYIARTGNMPIAVSNVTQK